LFLQEKKKDLTSHSIHEILVVDLEEVDMELVALMLIVIWCVSGFFTFALTTFGIVLFILLSILYLSCTAKKEEKEEEHVEHFELPISTNDTSTGIGDELKEIMKEAKLKLDKLQKI